MLSPSSADALTGARCALHLKAPAIGVCSRCGSFTCVDCQQVSRTGRTLCPPCFLLAPIPADRGARFVASLVDQLACMGPPFLAGVSAALWWSPSRPEEATLFGALALLCVPVTLGVLCYQMVLVSRSGQSIGKRMMGIRVVRTDGSRASLFRILLLRNAVPHLVSSLLWGVFGLVDTLSIFTSSRRMLHDWLADTCVVVAPRSEGRTSSGL